MKAPYLQLLFPQPPSVWSESSWVPERKRERVHIYAFKAQLPTASTVAQQKMSQYI